MWPTAIRPSCDRDFRHRGTLAGAGRGTRQEAIGRSPLYPSVRP